MPIRDKNIANFEQACVAFDIRLNLIGQGFFAVSGKNPFVVIVRLKPFCVTAESRIRGDKILSLLFLFVFSKGGSFADRKSIRVQK